MIPRKLAGIFVPSQNHMKNVFLLPFKKIVSDAFRYPSHSIDTGTKITIQSKSMISNLIFIMQIDFQILVHYSLTLCYTRRAQLNYAPTTNLYTHSPIKSQSGAFDVFVEQIMTVVGCGYLMPDSNICTGSY